MVSVMEIAFIIIEPIHVQLYVGTMLISLLVVIHVGLTHVLALI